MHVTYIQHKYYTNCQLHVNLYKCINKYYMVNLPSYNIKIDFGDIVEAHCYVEYKVDLVNFEHHII